MSNQASKAKPPVATTQSSLPIPWAEAIAANEGTDWLDTFPVTQPGKSMPGLQGKLLRVPEVATILRRSNATVRKYLRLGVLTGQHHVDEWRVSEADLNAFLLSTVIRLPTLERVGPKAAYPIPPKPANDPNAAVNDAAAPSPIFQQNKKIKPGQPKT
jgi:hypothetical protein